MLAAARSDNEEMINEVFEQEGTYDVNFQDGLGNTGAFPFPFLSAFRFPFLSFPLFGR